MCPRHIFQMTIAVEDQFLCNHRVYSRCIPKKSIRCHGTIEESVRGGMGATCLCDAVCTVAQEESPES